MFIILLILITPLPCWFFGISSGVEATFNNATTSSNDRSLLYSNNSAQTPATYAAATDVPVKLL